MSVRIWVSKLLLGLSAAAPGRASFFAKSNSLGGAERIDAMEPLQYTARSSISGACACGTRADHYGL